MNDTRSKFLTPLIAVRYEMQADWITFNVFTNRSETVCRCAEDKQVSDLKTPDQSIRE